MISWIFYAIANMLCMVLCYLTNPIVVLFADEEGELPSPLDMWQTWDDSIDADFFVREKVPSWLNYGFDEHYQTIIKPDEELEKVGRTRYGVKLIKPFSFKEKVQRYFCRVGWLYRNCGYGFAFWGFGIDVDADRMKMLRDDDLCFGYDTSRDILIAPWIYKDDRVFGHAFGREFRWCHFLGWKIDYEPHHYARAMVANRLAIRWRKVE